MRLVFILNILSCSLFITLGMYAALRRRAVTRRLARNAPDRLFIILAAVLAIGTLGNAFFISAMTAREAALWFQVFAFTWYLSPGLFVLFSLSLTGRTYRPLRFLLLLPGILILAVHVFVPGAVLAGVDRVPLGWHTVYDDGSVWHWLNVANYTAGGLLSILILLIKGVGSMDELVRRRSAVVLASTAPTFIGAFLTGFLIRYFGHENYPPMLPIFLSLLAVGLAFALFRYDLLALTSVAVSERFLSSVYDAVVLTSGNGGILDTNIGFNPGRLSLLIPEARDEVDWLAKHAAMDGSFEARFAFEKNRTAPASMRVRSIVDSPSAYSGYLVTAHDLTAEKDLAIEVERRMAAAAALRSIEANFTRAFRAGPAGMLIIEMRSRVILDANDAISRLFNIPLHEIVGAGLLDLAISIPPEEIDYFESMLEEGRSCPTREIAFLLPDQPRVTCLISASPLRFAGKDAALFTLVDTSELDRLRNDLARSQRLESIGILAAGIAHDFNNILTAILGNISLLKMSMDQQDENSEALSRAETACFRARDLSRQLLTFSKGGEPNFEPTDMVQLVREAVRMATAGSTVVATFSVESGIPPGFVDPGQMLQCFNNIALNAVQAMPGGGTLHIVLRGLAIDARRGGVDTEIPADLEPGDYIAVEFGDSGPGIPAENRDRIFDPYFSTKKSGTGLGLTISYSIAQRHRGGIQVLSAPGQGARFIVYVRRSAQETGPAEERKLHRGKGEVLVMDDEYTVRTVVAHMLRRIGYEATVCADGEGAVAAVKAAQAQGRAFCAVILDLTVPAGMGGIDAAVRIRTLDPRVPLFVSSGYSDNAIMSNYTAYGFDGVIPKPFGIEELSKYLAGT